MLLTTETKKELFKKFGKSEKNTGSTEGQVAVFTHRINHLTDHLKSHKKDFVTQRSLLKLVGQRKSFCLLYTSPSPRDRQKSRMPSSA